MQNRYNGPNMKQNLISGYRDISNQERFNAKIDIKVDQWTAPMRGYLWAELWSDLSLVRCTLQAEIF